MTAGADDGQVTQCLKKRSQPREAEYKHALDRYVVFFYDGVAEKRRQTTLQTTEA